MGAVAAGMGVFIAAAADRGTGADEDRFGSEDCTGDSGTKRQRVWSRQPRFPDQSRAGDRYAATRLSYRKLAWIRCVDRR